MQFGNIILKLMNINLYVLVITIYIVIVVNIVVHITIVVRRIILKEYALIDIKTPAYEVAVTKLKQLLYTLLRNTKRMKNELG